MSCVYEESYERRVGQTWEHVGRTEPHLQCEFHREGECVCPCAALLLLPWDWAGVPVLDTDTLWCQGGQAPETCRLRFESWRSYRPHKWISANCLTPLTKLSFLPSAKWGSHSTHLQGCCENSVSNGYMYVKRLTWCLTLSKRSVKLAVVVSAITINWMWILVSLGVRLIGDLRSLLWAFCVV